MAAEKCNGETSPKRIHKSLARKNVPTDSGPSTLIPEFTPSSTLLTLLNKFDHVVSHGEAGSSSKPSNKSSAQSSSSDFSSHFLIHQLDHGKLVTELRNLPFESVLAMAKLILEEIKKSPDYSLEVFDWASALVESHFTEWTIAEDAHETLFELNEIFADQIDSMFLWEDVQGRAKALVVASKTSDAAMKEDVKYWHSLLEF